MSMVAPQSRKVAASSRFLTSPASRGRITGCTSRNETPTSNSGAAEIAATAWPERDQVPASETSNPAQAAKASTLNALPMPCNTLFAMDRGFSTFQVNILGPHLNHAYAPHGLMRIGRAVQK